jgi:hypothetical protein
MADQYTGELRRVGDHYEGSIKNQWDWHIILRGEVVEENGARFFRLSGAPGPVPENLLLPGEARKDGSVVA